MLTRILLASALFTTAVAAGEPASPPPPPAVAEYLGAAPASIPCLLRGPSTPDGPRTVEVRLASDGPHGYALSFPGDAERPAETWRLVADPGKGLFLSSIEWVLDDPGAGPSRTIGVFDVQMPLALPGRPRAGEFRPAGFMRLDAGAGAPPEEVECRAEVSWSTGRCEADGTAWKDALRLGVRFEFPGRTSDDVVADRTVTLVFARGAGFVYRRTSVDPEDAHDDETIMALPPR